MHQDSNELAAMLSRVAIGDRAAFRRVYEMTSAHLFAVALRILQRSEHAEEVLQDAFVSVWHNASHYNVGTSQPMTWLISIVRNKALDLLRSARVKHETGMPQNEDGSDADIEDERPNPLIMLMQAAESMAVRACIETLESTQRQSLALAYYHGMSHAEVAAQIGAPLGTVKAWVRRGLERLKRCLDAKT